MTTIYKFKAYYTDAGVGTAQDPAPTCTVINMADDSKLADAQATTASTNMPGLYSYEYSGADGLDCVAWFKTTDTGCDVKQLASYVSEKITTNLNADVAGVETKLDTVDSNVDAILADTGTDGVKLASTQGAINWAQQRILADVEGQGALDIQNINDAGFGKLTYGGMAGELNFGFATAGVHNLSEEGTGTLSEGYAFGVRNEGISGGMYNKATGVGSAAMFNDAQGTDGIGLKNVGEAQNVEGFDPDIATAAALTTVDNEVGVIDGIVDAIKVQTDKIPATPASAGEYTANIGAIKAKTDNLPLSPASSGEYTSALTAIQNDLDNPNQYKADVSNLALQATSLAIKGQTDKIPAAPAQTGEYNAALTAIQADLDNPNQYKADVSGLATQASVNAIPTTPLLAANYVAPDNSGIASILEDTGTTIPATLAGLATSAEVGAITMLDEVVVGSYTMQDILKILAAKMVGKATGGGTATITYRGVDDTSNVIVETVDTNGNRSAVTLTV